MDMRRGLDFDDTVLPDDVLPLGYDNDPRPSYREQLKLSQEKLYKLEAQRDKLLSALKAVEWVPIVDIWDENVIGCACCGATKEWGKHHPRCNVGTAIAAVEGV